MKPLTDKQRLDAAIKIADSAFNGEQRKRASDLYYLLDLIATLGQPEELLHVNADNFREFIPNFMEDTE